MDITLKELLEAGCHFGHQTVRWHPKMKPYIFTARDGVHIFDLAQTREGLVKAGEFVAQVIGGGGKVLGAELAVPRHALLFGTAADGQLHLSRSDVHLFAQPERGGQEPGQSRKVHVSAELMTLVQQRIER